MTMARLISPNFQEKEMLILVILVMIGVAGLGFLMVSDYNKSTKINSYEECVKAGNPAIGTYPEQCRANGRTFINTDYNPTNTVPKTLQ
jgi:hypothetical protein